MKITIRHVVAAHRVVDALVTTDDSKTHRIGHLPTEGWFCTCGHGKRCRNIPAVRDLIVILDKPVHSSTRSEAGR
ncbi:hypothetical protein ACFWUU_02090 [Kribbella sp. NPDC058693]|uniref:hypothetical protein n=1 Tax=Kribbella sp. NPDC058693 TaxID=3346602 RepID=UPI003656D09C